jgi:hypothetical protein
MSPQVKELLDSFEQAALEWGFLRSEGGALEADKAEAAFDAAKTALIAKVEELEETITKLFVCDGPCNKSDTPNPNSLIECPLCHGSFYRARIETHD